MRILLNDIKVLRLAQLIGRTDYAALGIITALCDHARTYYPAGDIGRRGNDWIGSYFKWDGDSVVLSDALVECRFADVDKEGKLFIADWDKLCGDGVKNKLARNGKKFHSGLPSGGRVPIPKATIKEVLSSGKCAECDSPSRLTVDHIKPVSKGGTNDRSNLQLLCMPCNSRKSDRI